MSDTAANISLQARKDFIRNNADLLAILHQTPEEVLQVCMASAELSKADRADLVLYMGGIDQPHPYARGVARDSFKQACYKMIAVHFCQALSDKILTVAMEATPEADAQLRELSFVTGQSTRPPAPPKPMSAAEQLDLQIRDDWAKLPADKIRLKENDPRYRKRLRELLDSDAIGFKSQATTLHDGSQL
jgi:hypothetical protein